MVEESRTASSVVATSAESFELDGSSIPRPASSKAPPHFPLGVLAILRHTLGIPKHLYPSRLRHLLGGSGTSTPPGISTAPVPSIATPLGVNGFSPLPPQTNGQPASEAIYTNGIHPYPGRSPAMHRRGGGGRSLVTACSLAVGCERRGETVLQVA